MQTVGQWRQRAIVRLKEAGIENPALDARLLAQAACKLSDIDIVANSERPLGRMERFRLERYLARRAGGEPVSRILGRREFWGMEFKVSPDTLDPRPDTETLVEAALAWARGQAGPLRILDLGTGTGCILIALLKELPEARGVGIDISAGARDVSHENALAHGVDGRADFRQGSWFEPLAPGDSFDLIVSNPPYIPESQMESLAREVKNHDPRSALTDGKDGLMAYKTIYPQLGIHLKPGGRAFFEMGFDQAADMQRLVEESKVTLCKIHKDLAGHSRVIELCCPN